MASRAYNDLFYIFVGMYSFCHSLQEWNLTVCDAPCAVNSKVVNDLNYLNTGSMHYLQFMQGYDNVMTMRVIRQYLGDDIKFSHVDVNNITRILCGYVGWNTLLF